MTETLIAGTVMTGLQFKEATPGKIFYKLTNAAECHFGFKYKTGYNEDHLPFNPKGTCSAGGLYFTEYDKIGLWIGSCGWYMRQVEIIDDSLVYIEQNKFKTNKFILREKQTINDWINASLDNALHVVRTNGYAIFSVLNQTEAICLEAIQKNIGALSCIKSTYQTEAVCLAAVRINGMALELIHSRNQSEAICLAAVQQNGFALQHVIQQTETICLEAVRHNAKLLYYVKLEYQTEKVLLAAAESNGCPIVCLKK